MYLLLLWNLQFNLLVAIISKMKMLSTSYQMTGEGPFLIFGNSYKKNVHGYLLRDINT
jgi:hypothetical protein